MHIAVANVWLLGITRLLLPSDMKGASMGIWFLLPQTKPALAQRLRELRHEKKWSQERLAEDASMHRTYLAGIESALRNPLLENLVKLANAFKITLADCFRTWSTDSGRNTPKSTLNAGEIKSRNRGYTD